MATMGRIQYDVPFHYSNKVLIGPWFEESSRYSKNCYQHDTTYHTDFIPLPNAKRSDNHLYTNKFTGEGVSLHISKDPDYLNNYSTSYDLSYNHFPRCFKGPLKRHVAFAKFKYEPEIDYTLNYGNITKYGLFKAKQDEWNYDTCVVRQTGITTYKDTFVAPTLEDFRIKRHATPLPNSTKISDPLLYNLGLRGVSPFQSPDNLNMVVVTPEPRCNPVTWECPTPLTQPRRCVEKETREDKGKPYIGTPMDLPMDCVRAGNKEFR